ncbi:mechanosensitive ion channel family protein [Pimelobacter simplex]|uniref:mechanosensitive ion channel family protein n=1 Tax=Nocardioides simplex TaxID=2045 RepID=UPI001932D8E4|nr:transporter [Pimelobacter simplex]
MNIDDSLQNALDRFIGFLPNLIGFLVLLIIGFIVAKLIQVAVRKGLELTGIDGRLERSNAHPYLSRALPGVGVSRAVSLVVFWFVLVFFAVAAVTALEIRELTIFMNAVLAYLPNVVVAIAIFVIAALLSTAIATGVSRMMGDTPTGKIVATVLPAVVMVIAMFMILEQLQIAPEIVRIAFAATMGALALGLALAFGLGGRPVAQRVLEDAYAKGREEAERTRYNRRASRAGTETGPSTGVPAADQGSMATQQFGANESTAGAHTREGRGDVL